jgi:ribosomal protein S24E
MEITKTASTTNAVLKRTDATYRVVYEGATPSRHAVVDAIAKKEKGLVIVRHVYTGAGEQVATVVASVYADAAIAGVVERANLITKQKPAAAAPAGA